MKRKCPSLLWLLLIIYIKSVPKRLAAFACYSTGTKRDSKQDNRLYINLTPHRQEEVERLLQEGGGRGWKQLGTALGYEPEQLDLFGRGEAPARTLLSNWAQKEGSTLGLLCSALARIERPDVVTALNCPAQGVSVVWQLRRLEWRTLLRQGRHSKINNRHCWRLPLTALHSLLDLQ